MKDDAYQKFEILKDQPLTDRELDKFGYSEIADSLIEIIKKVTPPFTIGLYGQWGVGKSTICKIVEDTFKKDSDYKVFYFDTWKYERDSFRRQFLIELDHDVFGGSLDHKNKLNQTLTLPYSLPFWQNFKESFKTTCRDIITKVLILILGIIGLACILFVSRYFFNFAGSYKNTLSFIVSAIFDLGLIAYIIKFIVESVKTLEGQSEVAKTDSAEGFEHYYKEALEKIGSKKLLVVIDNLDRLESNRAVELLSDIKTFLASEKVDHTKNKAIFLIPCDNHALTTQLTNFYKELDTEEYLRKFFNLSIKIPKLLNLELDDYVTGKLKETNIEEFTENPSLSFVISRACQNNPREIIQFVNSLTSVFILAKSRKLKEVYEKEKVPFLAKILAIRIKWPDVYDYVENEILRTGSNLDEIVGINFSPNDFEGGNEFKIFIRATEIIVDNQREDIFFAIKETEGQSRVPEWGAFISAAEDRRDKDLGIAFENIIKQNKLHDLVSMLAVYIRKNKDKEAKLINVFVSLSTVINESNLKTFESYIREIFTFLKSHNFITVLGDINFGSIVNPSFDTLSHHIKSLVKDKLVGITESTYSNDKIDERIVNMDLNIWNILSRNNSILNPMSSSDRNLKERLTRAKENYIRKISVATLFPRKPVTQTFLNDLLNFVYMNYPIERSLYSAVCSFSFTILQYAPLQTKDDITLILNRVLYFFDQIGSVSKIQDNELVPYKQLVSQLHALANNPDWDIKSLCIRILLKFDTPQNPQKDEMNNRIASFINDLANSGERIIETFTSEQFIKLTELPVIRNAFIQRISNNPDLFINYGLKADLISEEELKNVLLKLATQKAPEFIKFIAYLNYQIPNAFIDELILTMIRQLNFSDSAILEKWLEILEKLGMKSAHLQEFMNYLRTTWNSRGQDHKKMISDFVKRNKGFFGDAFSEELKSE